MKRDTPLPIEFLDSCDDELEHHISSCWQMVTKEYEAGNREGADYWRLAAQEAQKLRSPEQVKKMEDEMGLGPAPCFFTEAGQEARAGIEAQS